jgi:hypothetical protein
MGRILPFYRTGGVVSGGGGGGGNTGVPLGPFNDWSELPASAAGGSLAFVSDLGPSLSSGIARYDTGDAEWKLLLGTFETLAHLQAFTDPINSLALATVGISLDDPESVRYQWDDTVPEWVRTPDPVEYIYAANTWGTLPTQDTIKPSDEVIVGDLGYSHSSGRGQRHGSEWRLIEGKFQSVADMTAFDVANPVHTDAIGLVKAGGGHDEEAIAYSYQGSAWVRFGTTTTAGYAWTLTETQLLTGADPSGIGALRDGDWGTYTPANGAPIVVRFKAACDVAPGAGDGTRPVWMIPEAYAGNPEVVAYLTGSETGVLADTLAAQGWTVATTGVGAVTLNDGYVRCAGTANVSGTAQVATSATWLGSQRFCVQGLLRGSAGGSDPYVGLFQLNNNDIQYTFIRGNLSGAFRHFVLTGTPPALTWTTVDSLNSLPSPTLNLNDTTPWFFQAIGRTLAENAETRINGELYGSMRRNLDTATTLSAMNLALYANSGGSGTVSTLDSKTLTILTY